MKRLLSGALAGALAGLLSIGTAAAAETWNKLVTPQELAALDDVAILDIRDDKAYRTAHVPGAVNTPYPAFRGPGDNPGDIIGDAALTEILQGAGLTQDTRVVITHAGVDQTDFGAAARVYWTLKSAGFPTLAILNGGVKGWVDAGQPLTSAIPEITPTEDTFVLSGDYMIDREGVAAVIDGARQATLVDARPPAFFRGEAKHGAASKPGTLKGATSFPFAAFFEGDKTEIADAAHAAAAAADVGGEGEIVSFCNTGHWAATNWFALSELAGKDNVKLYPASMVGWLKDGGEVVNGN